MDLVSAADLEDLDDLRNQIDRIDDELLELIALRQAHADRDCHRHIKQHCKQITQNQNNHIIPWRNS